jgi:translocation and assembly module TamB
MWLVVAAILLLVTLPAWFPWFLKPLLSCFQLGFKDYDRIGWTQFELKDVHGEWKNVRVEAARVNGTLPPWLLWRTILSNTNSAALLTLADGKLLISRPTITKEPGSTDRTLDRIRRTGKILRRVLPASELTNCAVVVRSYRISIPQADWRNGRLHVLAELPSFDGGIQLTARMGERSSIHFDATSRAHDASIRTVFTEVAERWRMEGEAFWLTNRAEFSAQFSTNRWAPAQARLDCPNFIVPAAMVLLRGYEDLNATLEAVWATNRYTVQATGFARPSGAAEARLRQASFSLAADGDTNTLTVGTAQIQSPWLNANLSSPITVNRTGEFVSGPAQFEIEADLSRLSGDTLAGRAQGTVRVTPQGRQPPAAQFRMLAEKIRLGRFDIEDVFLSGKFSSPGLQLDEFTANLVDGSKLTADGTLDVETRRITNANWRISGAFLKQLLPTVDYDQLTGSGAIRGPLTNLSQSGEITISGLRGGLLKPLELRAKWDGQNLRINPADVTLTAGKSLLSVGGTLDLSRLKSRNASATLTNFSLRNGEESSYALQHSCKVSFAGAGTNVGSRNWTLAIDSLNWRGTNREVSLSADLSWPARGDIKAAMTNVSLSDFSDFVAANIASASLATADFTASWSNGPVRSAISVVGALTNRTGQGFVVRGAVQTDEAVSVNQLSVATGYTPTLSVTGTVPVRIVPAGREGWLEWNEAGTIAMAGDWEEQESEEFQFPLKKRGEIRVMNPQMRIRVSGTPEKPFASLSVAVGTIVWQPPTNSALRFNVEDLKVNAGIRPDRITLETLSARLDGQPVDATGEWPLAEGDWNRLWDTHELPEWSQARGRLQLEGAEIAAVSRHLPRLLAPEGVLSAKLDLQPGRKFEGILSFTNASTRPFGKLTPLRDIDARVRMEGQRAVLEQFNGFIGGQPVQADGFVTIQDDGDLDYQIHLRGTNVPVARSLELLLRGDFDVHLRGGSNSPPVLSGKVDLHDGLFLQHASAMVWSGPKRQELRPPYFNVTNEPVADWGMDLDISGDEFLRVRTPVFNGLLSADLRLKGILRAPILTGDVRVDSGRLVFPFGRLGVNQGFASFTGNDPQGPDLQIAASGQNYRYDIKLDVSGPASNARATFSSTPPLTSEDILLMLTVGEMPKEDYTFTSQARVGRLASYLGKDLFSRFWGGDQEEERLTIQTGESISEEGRLTYSVEYRLTDWLSIIGEYDEFNAFNADLKWKVFAR